MSAKKTKTARQRSDRRQAYTWVITITAEQAELIERIVETEYSSFASCRTFRGMALTAFHRGLKALRDGYHLGEREADPESPVFAKLPEGFKPGTRKLTLTEEAVMVAEFMTGIFPDCDQAKKFQKAAEQIMSLGIAMVEELLIRHKNAERRGFQELRDQESRQPSEETEGRRTGEDRRQRQLTPEEYYQLHGIEPKATRLDPPVSWPKQVDEKPTATVDDLPDLFGE